MHNSQTIAVSSNLIHFVLSTQCSVVLQYVSNIEIVNSLPGRKNLNLSWCGVADNI